MKTKEKLLKINEIKVKQNNNQENHNMCTVKTCKPEGSFIAFKVAMKTKNQDYSTYKESLFKFNGENFWKVLQKKK